MSKTSSSEEGGTPKMKSELDHLRSTLLDEIDAVRSTLGTLRGAEVDSVKADLDAKEKWVESLNDNEISSFKLSRLQKEINKIRTRADSLVAKSLTALKASLLEETDRIERNLVLLDGDELSALKSEMVDKRQRLKALKDDELSSFLASIQTDISDITEKGETLITKAFLQGEIGRIEKIIGSIKVNPLRRAELKDLEAEKEDKKKMLASTAEYDLSALRKEITKLKERADSLTAKEGLFVKLGRVSILVWLGIIPLLIAIYVGYFAILQGSSQTLIHDFATQTAQALPTPTATMVTTSTPVP